LKASIPLSFAVFDLSFFLMRIFSFLIFIKPGKPLAWLQINQQPAVSAGQDFPFMGWACSWTGCLGLGWACSFTGRRARF
jgi:hypothetical protein